MSDRARGQESLREKDTVLRSFYDASTVMMGTVELVDGDILHVSDNQATATFFGTTPQAMRGRTARDMGVPEPYLALWLKAYRASAASRKPVLFDYRHGDKGWLRVTVNYIGPVAGGVRFCYVVDDVTDSKTAEKALQELNATLERRVRERTEELEKLNVQLHFDAFHDALTGLPNRPLFMDHLRKAVERFKRHPEVEFAVLFLDFDRFKVINDSLGHDVGDALLVAIAGRLRECVREADVLARFGGDEFTILLECGLEQAEEVVERLQTAFSQPFDHVGHQLHVTVSVGIVVSDERYQHPEEVLRDADLAMYSAKAHHAGQHRVFDAAMRTGAVRRLTLENELRAAVPRGELRVYYQPVFSVGDKSLRGFEALLRWQHPERGLLLPADFIPTAEETALIVQLDRYALAEGCRQLSEWRGRGSNVFLNVNVSAQQFGRADLLTYIGTVLAQTSLGPEHLNLEITENALLNVSEPVNATLAGLKALGVGLYLDDFGTGYSSLAYLQRFPADALKIDRSFTQQLTQSPQGEGLLRTILMMAQTFGMKAVVEGVETQEELTRLAALGCEYGQGYLYAKPLSAADATALLERTKGFANTGLPEHNTLSG